MKECRKAKLIVSRKYNACNHRSAIPALAFCGFDVTGSLPKGNKYPKSLITIGDHLRKCRMDLSLFQCDVAEIIGVSEDCVTYWENGRSTPQIQHIPKIIQFLGYNPAPFELKTLGDKVRDYRLKHGLSHKKFGKIIGVDASTISSWEKGEFQPKGKTQCRLTKILSIL